LADESSFLLSNNAGSFFYHDWKTRNGGWFVHDEDTFRVIAEMRTASPRVSAIIHSGSKVEMKKNGIREMFTLPEGKNVLVYKTNTPLDTDIFLDVRKLNDNRQWGRHYNIKVEGGKTIIHFMKSTDAREDKTNGQHEYDFFIVLDKPARVVKRWQDRIYTDETHDAASYSRLIFHAVRVWATSMTITASQNLQQALDAQENIKINQRIDDESALTVQALKNFFEPLGVKSAFSVQWGTRDEIIAAAAIAKISPRHAKEIIMKNARAIMNDGRLTETMTSETRIADGTGWLFKRCYEMIDLFSPEEKKYLTEKIVDVIETLHERHTKDGFAFDVIDEQTIDAQALRLALYKSAFGLTKNELYYDFEKKLKNKVRDAYWNGEQLAQSMGNYAPHPKIVLAAYIYPDLLTKEEWSSCFTQMLKGTWLEWGGLKIEEKSLFWMNNIAALCFLRTNKILFNNHIQKITNASKREMLWQGCLGMHGESSTAAILKSNGSCDIKSTATYMELMDEMNKNNVR
ncbi:MAG TPA: hypothetical protein VJK72_05680, partial [Candidatus Nanoarchaeia archaeon]|nr:hypothetical protein [Candidatus Nanoarchaeia archaeon]